MKKIILAVLLLAHTAVWASNEDTTSMSMLFTPAKQQELVQLIQPSKPIYQKEGSAPLDMDFNQTAVAPIPKDYKAGINLLADAETLILAAKIKNEVIIDRILDFYEVNREYAYFKFIEFPPMKVGFGNSMPTYNPPITNTSDFIVGSGIHNMNVTGISTGMARFLAMRAKQELHETFFTQMYKQMHRMQDLIYFFPESYYFLDNFASGRRELDINIMRSKFNQDVEQLPMQMFKLLDNSSMAERYPQLQHVQSYFNEDPYGMLSKHVLNVVLSTSNKNNLGNFLENLSNLKDLDKLYTKLQKDSNSTPGQIIQTIKISNIVMNSFTGDLHGNPFIMKDKFDEFLDNDTVLSTYIGLLSAISSKQEYNIRYNNQSLSEAIDRLCIKDYEPDVTKIRAFKDWLSNMYIACMDINNVFDAQRSEEQKNLPEIYKVYHIVKHTITHTNNDLLPQLFQEHQTDNINTVTRQYIVPALDIAYNIYAKNYPLIIKDLVYILDNASTHNSVYKHKSYNKFVKRFNTYGSLISSVAYAQNSDEIKAAIDATVLPAGSSRIKRKAYWSFMVNAYVGTFYGHGMYNNEVIPTFGMTAPIGVTIARGNMRFLGKQNTLGLNLHLVDLGNLVNFYFKNGDAAQLPADATIEISDIIAPGATLSYSLWNSPISLFAGAQYVPALNRLPSIPTNDGMNPITWRWQVGVAVDIPLYTIKVVR